MRNHLLAIALAAFGCKKHEEQAPAAPPPSRPTPQPSQPPAPPPAKLDTAAIEKLTGAKGKLDDKSGVFKVSVPRKDLAVTVAEHIKVTPAMGLTAWAA